MSIRRKIASAEVADTVDDAALVRVLKALAHPKRLKLVQEIAAAERCCSELSGCVDAAQPTISHHLKILCDAGVVTMRRQGQRCFPMVNHELLVAALGGLPARIRPMQSAPPRVRRARIASAT